MENVRELELSGLPFEMAYISFEISPGMSHDEVKLQYEDLQEVVVHELGENYWVVDDWFKTKGSPYPVYLLCESEYAYVLTVDVPSSDRTSMTVAIWVHAKGDHSLTNDPSFKTDAARLFRQLYVQYSYALRPAGLSSSRGNSNEFGRKHLQIIKGGSNGQHSGSGSDNLQ